MHLIFSPKPFACFDLISHLYVSPQFKFWVHLHLVRLISLGITWKWGCLQTPRTFVLAVEKEQFL